MGKVILFVSTALLRKGIGSTKSIICRRICGKRIEVVVCDPMMTPDLQALESKFHRSTDEAARERREARLVEVAKCLRLNGIFTLDSDR